MQSLLNMKIITCEKTEEFIVYLLKQIENFKEDWFIENQEMQTIKNEIVNFKKIVQNSPLVPLEIKNKILGIQFEFDEVKQYRKQLFRNFFSHSSAEAKDSGKFKIRLDELRIELTNILKWINLHK